MPGQAGPSAHASSLLISSTVADNAFSRFLGLPAGLSEARGDCKGRVEGGCGLHTSQQGFGGVVAVELAQFQAKLKGL
jgi:hypothetical protein